MVNIYKTLSADLINYLKINNLQSVRIINSHLNKSLAYQSSSGEETRNVFTELNPEFGNWVLENIGSSYKLCRIRTKPGGEYLFASDVIEEDSRRRKLFTQQLLPENLNKTADWEFSKVQNGYLIKNIHYSEYLFTESDNQYSVFTSESIENEAVWTFQNNFTGKEISTKDSSINYITGG